MTTTGGRSMQRFLILAGLTGALAAPVAARADTPTTTDRQNASQECRFERGSTAATREAFATRYGTNKNKANAFGKCVSGRARDESRERTDAEANAPQACRAERGTTDASKAAFALKYGTNHNGKNAFGKCVSAKAKELEVEADDADRADATAHKRAAKTCAAERKADGKAFTEKYGTGKHKRNAFGKCVSRGAKAIEHEGGTP
jgi:hypothetical protein